MTIQEMHIAVNLGVQKIASFQVDNLLSEEIDHELNVAMDKFIKLRYSPLGNKYRDGFEQSQKRIDDLRNLVVDFSSSATYAGSTVNNYEIDRIQLPRDYMFLINFHIEESQKCNATNDDWIQTLPQPIHYVKVPLLNGDNKLKDITFGNSSIFADLPEGTILDQEYFLNPNFSNINWYTLDSLTTYGDTLNFPIGDANFSHTTPTVDSNHILLVYVGSTNTTSITAKYETNISTTLDLTNVNIARRIVSSDSSSDGTIVDVKESASFVQNDDIFTVLSDPFNRPTYDKVKYTIQENFIYIYTDNTFITNLGHIKYIRYPKRMNTAEGTGCELPEHTHQEIVEMAVKGILESIQDPRYQSQSREVLESE